MQFIRYGGECPALSFKFGYASLYIVHLSHIILHNVYYCQ
jgi:hypothetical protein